VDARANASQDAQHDQPLDACLLPSQLLTLEVLRRPVESTQYLSAQYGRRLAAAQLRASAARSAYDNAMVESWFHTLKNELVYRHRWATRPAADLAVFHYIGWYNQRRRHSALNMRSPVRHEQKETTPTLCSQA